MSFVLDTNVVSEVRKARPHHRVRSWFGSVDAADLYLSVLVVGEIVQGVERLRRRDPDQARVYDEWLVQLRTDFAHRILPVDVAVAEEWGRMTARDPLPVIDGLLAATAKVRGWTLVTRNIKDVDRSGVMFIDPFAAPS